MRIQTAKLSHLEALLKIENSVFLSDHLGRRSFRALIQSSTAQVFVLVPEQQTPLQNLAGYAIVLSRKNSHWLRLYSLAIAPEYQGQGLSRRLMRHVIAAAQQVNAQGMRLEVNTHNQAAYNLYLQFGFEPLKLLPFYYQDGSDAYRMQLILPETK